MTDLHDIDLFLSVHEDISLVDLQKLIADLQRELYIRERIHNTVCIICRTDFQYSGKNVLRNCCSKDCSRKAYQKYIGLITKADLERREYIARNLINSPVYKRSSWRNHDLIATADMIVYGGAAA